MLSSASSWDQCANYPNFDFEYDSSFHFWCDSLIPFPLCTPRSKSRPSLLLKTTDQNIDFPLHLSCTESMEMFSFNCTFPHFSKVFLPYSQFDKFCCTIKAFSTRKEGLLRERQNHLLRTVAGPLQRFADVDLSDTFFRLPNIDDAMRYLTYFSFDCLHFYILNYDPYIQRERWNELVNYTSEIDKLPEVFAPSLIWCSRCLETTACLLPNWMLSSYMRMAMFPVLQPLLLLSWLRFTQTAVCCVWVFRSGGTWGSERAHRNDRTHSATSVHLLQTDKRRYLNFFRDLPKRWAMWRKRGKRTWYPAWFLLPHLYWHHLLQKHLTKFRSRCFQYAWCTTSTPMNWWRIMSSFMVFPWKRTLACVWRIDLSNRITPVMIVWTGMIWLMFSRFGKLEQSRDLMVIYFAPLFNKGCWLGYYQRMFKWRVAGSVVKSTPLETKACAQLAWIRCEIRNFPLHLSSGELSTNSTAQIAHYPI